MKLTDTITLATGTTVSDPKTGALTFTPDTRTIADEIARLQYAGMYETAQALIDACANPTSPAPAAE